MEEKERGAGLGKVVMPGFELGTQRHCMSARFSQGYQCRPDDDDYY